MFGIHEKQTAQDHEEIRARTAAKRVFFSSSLAERSIGLGPIALVIDCGWEYREFFSLSDHSPKLKVRTFSVP